MYTSHHLLCSLVNLHTKYTRMPYMCPKDSIKRFYKIQENHFVVSLCTVNRVRKLSDHVITRFCLCLEPLTELLKVTHVFASVLLPSRMEANNRCMQTSQVSVDYTKVPLHLFSIYACSRQS